MGQRSLLQSFREIGRQEAGHDWRLSNHTPIVKLESGSYISIYWGWNKRDIDTYICIFQDKNGGTTDALLCFVTNGQKLANAS